MSSKCQGYTKNKQRCRKIVKNGKYCIHHLRQDYPISSEAIDVFIPLDIVSELAYKCILKGRYTELFSLMLVCKDWYSEIKEFIELNIDCFKFFSHKYIGKTFKEVYENHPKYLESLFNKKTKSVELNLYKKYVYDKLNKFDFKSLVLRQHTPNFIYDELSQSYQSKMMACLFINKLKIEIRSLHSPLFEPFIGDIRKLYENIDISYNDYMDQIRYFCEVVKKHFLCSLTGKKFYHDKAIDFYCSTGMIFNSAKNKTIYLSSDTIDRFRNAYDKCRTITETSKVLKELFLVSLGRIKQHKIAWPTKYSDADISFIDNIKFDNFFKFLKSHYNDNCLVNNYINIPEFKTQFKVEFATEDEIIDIKTYDYFPEKNMNYGIIVKCLSLKFSRQKPILYKEYNMLRGSLTIFNTSRINIDDWIRFHNSII